MLFALARQAQELGHKVVVVGPAHPEQVVLEARSRGFETEALPSLGRAGYMFSLRRWWKKERRGLLWCNGLLPAVATSGLGKRVVHLHQIPSAKLKGLVPYARKGAVRTVVPSAYMKISNPEASVLPNWNERMPSFDSLIDENFFRVGFMGRFSIAKGLPVLIRALDGEIGGDDRRVKLVLAGEHKFVNDADRRAIASAIENSQVQIEQIGWVRPAQFFSSVDLVVIPSVWPESFGLVATETMSARVPLIVSNAGALPQIVGDEYPWIARAGDSEDLNRVITTVLETSEEQRQQTVDRAYRRWESRYSPIAGRKALDELLKSIEGK